jgi:hypothetical protein
MKKFPIEDLKELEDGYKELKADYAELNNLFNEAVENLDVKFDFEEKMMFEDWLRRLKSIEKQMKDFKKQLDKNKQELAN